ncbi:hypothetical protein WJX73_005601 [Symbiochloris irregularis]|uniref:Uncharacterized protein n=1 Tax=Symbiochloris irregularis TaxID=706552 RepID=A0AAW1PV32_9CHLO
MLQRSRGALTELARRRHEAGPLRAMKDIPLCLNDVFLDDVYECMLYICCFLEWTRAALGDFLSITFAYQLETAGIEAAGCLTMR